MRDCRRRLRLTIRDVVCGRLRGRACGQQPSPHTLVRQNGMAASKTKSEHRPARSRSVRCLSASALRRAPGRGGQSRRAPRDAAELPAVVTIGNLEELAREHGSELSEQTLAYAARALRKPGARLRPDRQAERGRAAARAARRRRSARRDRRPARARAAAHDQGRSRRDAPAAAHLGRAGGVAGATRASRGLLDQTRAARTPAVTAQTSISSGAVNSSPPVLGRPPGPA